ncbi:DUF2804 domain-containing protein [Phenylobacterium sp.]|uniref:DUF2804 domain-containing protein n=1 Tax=Phenylobacterium sp. TaxID=1871053 RepID=UPI0035AE0417
MAQIELGVGDLLDRRGRLAEAGWARREARRYRRAAIAASPLRIKEWDYYCVLAGDYGLAAVVADNGYMGFASVVWLDFRVRSFATESVITPFPLGRMGMPQSADEGDVVFDHPRLKLAFRHMPGGRRLTVDCPAFDKGRGLRGALDLAQPPMDRMVIATPWPDAPKAFYYNQKINCLAAAGEVVVGGETYGFQPDRAFGVLDWGRGVWTYRNTWYWGSASGLLDGRPFGFNIGYGFGDTSAASENMVFVDGAAHKLDQVTFHLPAGTFDGAPWRFSSNDGRLEMTFDPILDRADATDLRILRTDTHQVFGRFSGAAVLDDGRRLEFRDLLGFAEKVENAW